MEDIRPSFKNNTKIEKKIYTYKKLNFEDTNLCLKNCY